MSIKLSSLLNKLEEIYQELPSVPCKTCGQCCVSPTITLIEFIYLMDGIFKNFSISEIQHFFTIPSCFHKTCEGNLICRFINKENLCSAHKFRSMACRLHGHPVIDLLNIENQENCLKIDHSSVPNISLEALKNWLKELSEINAKIIDYYSAPLWISGFNIECWLDIIYDPYIEEDSFGKIKNIIKEVLPQFSKLEYFCQTNLKEKIDKIYLFHETIKIDVSKDTLKILNSIIKDYPKTGTYYLKEAQEYKNIIKNEVKLK